MLVYNLCVLGVGGNTDRKSNLGFYEEVTCKCIHEK